MSYRGPINYDPDVPGGFQDADFDQRELEARGAEFGRARKRSESYRDAGDLPRAAAACPHGGGYPLDSEAARRDNDPRAGQDGQRCSDCGSVLSAFPFETTEPVRVIHPCDWLRASSPPIVSRGPGGDSPGER
jgi:hypothetical protein